MNNIKIETHPLIPFIPDNAKILMLGTFPPKKERWSMEFFYPIFYNNKYRFWFNTNKCFILADIQVFAQEKGIALFDTAYRVRRLKDNASDKFLEIVEPTDIK